MDKKNTFLLFYYLLVSNILFAKSNFTRTEDTNPLEIVSITRNLDETTDADEVSFTITFNQAIKGVLDSDFLISGTSATISTSTNFRLSDLDSNTNKLNALTAELNSLNTQLSAAIASHEANKASILKSINEELLIIVQLETEANNVLATDPSKEVEARQMLTILAQLKTNLLNQKTAIENSESDAVKRLKELVTAKQVEVNNQQGILETFKSDATNATITISGGNLADLDGIITLSINPTNTIQSYTNLSLSNIIPTGVNENTYTIKNSDLSNPLINSLSKEVKVIQNQNQLTIKSPFQIDSIEILDYTGSKVFTTTSTKFTTYLASGVYILKLDTNKGFVFKRFLKQ
ncbi:T9SS type A sorting domain-containing protein [Wenyingzhuangia sp. IMCC45574]